MSKALLEIMKPLIEPIIVKRENEKWQQGLQQGIQNAIDILRRLGHNEIEIENEIREQYGLTTEAVKTYMSKYSEEVYEK